LEESDDDASDGSDHSSETSGDDEFSLTAGLIISFGNVVLKVRRIVARGTHVICFVVEPGDKNYLAGSERVLTMAVARQLYIDYINN
jgi:hypothetical protein